MNESSRAAAQHLRKAGAWPQVALALALASCSGGPGTADVSDPACTYDVEAVPLELPWQSGRLTVAEHVALLNTEWTVRGEVAPLDELALVLSVDPEAAVLHERDATRGGCLGSPGWLSLDADVHLTLGDTFAFVASGLLLDLTTQGAQLFQAFCWDPETHTASLAEESCEAGVELGFLSLELEYRAALDGPGSYLLDRFSIYWDSSANTDHYALVTEPPTPPEP